MSDPRQLEPWQIKNWQKHASGGVLSKKGWMDAESGKRLSPPKTGYRFVNPANGYTEAVDKPFLWCLLFGSFYLAFKGAWSHALISFALAIPTCGASWLVYPFFAGSVVRTSYLRRGWVPAEQWRK
ncbi:hypothetical protein [Desulfovibrio aminophilus]|uniref:hypothetical protein n=1 Tax=Desulfovibrio aminophilus TaxID=81425 RepID=UPI00041532C7|nr:hypothetical protein [Desulfovibrio aminophilus]